MTGWTRLLLLPALLACLWPSPGSGPCEALGLAQAAPWSGIVGFLQTVARLQERPVRPESTEDDGEDADDHKPLRKIVYGVEEQVSGEDGTATGSSVVYDSLTAATTTRPENELDSNVERKRRSSEKPILAVSDKGTGRNAGGIATRPFLIGRRLWYVPLWFSVYLILYILALTVKSVARHRIKYPTLVSEDALLKRRNGYVKSDVTRRVTNAITNGERRYQNQWSM